MLHWIDCDSIYLCSYGSSYCIGLIVTLSICVLNFMLHWVDCGIVYLCSHGSPSCCMGLIVTLFICVPMFLPHFALDWLWCWLSVFSWFFSMLHWIDCGIVCLCSHSSSSYRFVLIVTVFIRVLMCLPFCIGLIVTWFVFVLVVLPHVALDWLWHCLSVFLLFFLMLHWIDRDIVYLCSYGSSSCCIILIVTLFVFVLVVLPHVALIVTLFFCVLMVLPHVALNFLWHCLSVFLWFNFMLHWIYCGIVYLCSHGSSSCCIGLIVALFICILIGLPHVALDWLWQCLSVFSWFFLMLHCIDCDSVYLWSHGSYSCCLGLIVTLFICVHMVLPQVALDWLWNCLSVFLWLFLISIGLIVTVFIPVPMVLTHVALDWLWHCFTCVLMGLPHVALYWLWHCLSVFLLFFLMLHWIDCDVVYLCSYGSFSCCIGFWHCLWSHGSSSCCIGLIVALFVGVRMARPHVALDCDIVRLCSHRPSSCWIGFWYSLSMSLLFFLMLPWIICDIV